MIQPEETSTLAKRNFIFEIMFERFDECPVYMYATTERGKVNKYIIYYNTEEGIYHIDKENLHLETIIIEIMSGVNEQINEAAKTDIIYKEGKVVVNNWFVKRKLTEVSNYIKMFKEELIQRDLIKTPREFRKFSYYDRDEQFVLVNTQNSTLKINIKTSEIDELEFSPNFYFMSKLDAIYTPEKIDKDWDYWMSFLEAIIPNKNERERLQNWCSYALINMYFDWQASIMFYGPLAFNGKTTFMNAFGSLFGDRCETVTLREITEKFGTEKLANADFIIADESSANFEDVSKLKQILEGAKTNIEGKGTASYTGLIDSKVIIATNKLSTSLISDSGIARRIDIITTPHSFSKSEDTNIKDELFKIKDTILFWAITVMSNMVNNITKYKQGIKERTEKKYRDNETPFNNFFAIYGNEYDEVLLEDIVQAYELYRRKYQTKVMNALQIGKILTNDYPDLVRKRNQTSKIEKGTSTILIIGISLNQSLIAQDLAVIQTKIAPEDWSHPNSTTSKL